ncbi:hypothetical protein [Okeania sp.]|uniref:hypothetical protein n=1 Tax=Okeania sp. TaxID=3100323 RepID=UPI002B4B8D36|nr:hypothetical protein [Okeania sp.]MEB3340930.1 hypothetical protein [Okeania sp.]
MSYITIYWLDECMAEGRRKNLALSGLEDFDGSAPFASMSSNTIFGGCYSLEGCVTKIP